MIDAKLCRLLKAALAAGTLAMAACTSSGTSYESAQLLPKPDVIIVERFAASPDEVRISEGLSTELHALVGNAPRTPDEREVGHKVAEALAQKLVLEIRDLGLPAEVGTAPPADARSPLLITGQLTSIDEGNQAERVIIGLGAGRSDVRVQAQVYSDDGGREQLVEQVEVDAKSGMAPGMLETAGAGALTGHLLASVAVSGGLHVASEELSTDVVADADRAAKGLAKQLAVFFGQQGWID